MKKFRKDAMVRREEGKYRDVAVLYRDQPNQTRTSDSPVKDEIRSLIPSSDPFVTSDATFYVAFDLGLIEM